MVDTLKASEDGLKIVDEARRKKRWQKNASIWVEVAGTSEATLRRFWARKSGIDRYAFIGICQAVGVNWEEIAQQGETKETELPLVSTAKAHPSIPNQNFVGRCGAIAPSIPDRHVLRQLPYCNLLNQTNEFIGRQTELKDLLKLISLNYRAPIITVDGIGGVGKTALVLEVAYQSWEAKHSESPKDIPIFDAIIFNSAKESYLLPDGLVSRLPKQNTLRDIFEAIALTLDDP